MFRETIRQTALTTDVANGMFDGKVVGKRGSCFKEDVTFLSTLRALVMPRMAKGEQLIFETFSTRYHGDASISEIIGEASVQKAGTFTILYDKGGDRRRCDNGMENVIRSFPTSVEGYERVEKISTFFRGKGEEDYFRVLCFIHPVLKSVVLFTSNIDSMKKWHFLQLAIVPSLPWYFKDNQPVEEPERGFCTSLREATSEMYLKYIGLIANQYDFRSEEIKQTLSGFEVNRDKEQLQSTLQNLQGCDRDIDNYQTEISELLRQRDELCVKIMGLERKISNNDSSSELVDYFLCNSSLFVDEVDGSTVTFSVANYLTYFDKEMVETILNNPRGFVYQRECGDSYNGVGSQKMAKLIRAVFIDELLRLKSCAAYTLQLDYGVMARGHHSFKSELENFFPNTHINEHSCLGNYKIGINESLRDNDYVGAVSQCVASCGSLNFGDSTVMYGFMRELYKTRRECIELPDGTSVGVTAAIEWLESQGGAEQNSHFVHGVEPRPEEEEADEVPLF